MTFIPAPFQLTPEAVAARKQQRETKLHQSYDETVAEVRRERQLLKRSGLRKTKVTRSNLAGRYTTR